MNRSTPYRYTCSSAPMAGKAPIEPMDDYRRDYRFWAWAMGVALLCAGVFVAFTVAVVAYG